MKEEWKFVKGFGKRYQVSNLGSLRSLTDKNNKLVEPHPIKTYLNKHKMVGRYEAYLYYPNSSNKRKNIKVHTLVAQAFVPNPEKKPEINHIDGNKLNNISTNLEWVTRRENRIHAVKMGLIPFIKGEDRNDSKLTDEKVRYIRKSKGTISQKELAKMFNLSQATVWAAQNKVTWKHV
jgi:DNA-binding transcriptional regulator YiaG